VKVPGNTRLVRIQPKYGSTPPPTITFSDVFKLLSPCIHVSYGLSREDLIALQPLDSLHKNYFQMYFTN
jgi:hypothetical protein